MWFHRGGKLVGIAYGEGAGRISRRCPARTSVQAHALVGDDAEDASSAEGLGVGLPLDLEHIEGQQDDLADADQAEQGPRSANAPHTRWAAECGRRRQRSTHLPAVACMMALPVPLPNAASKSPPWLAAK